MTAVDRRGTGLGLRMRDSRIVRVAAGNLWTAAPVLAERARPSGGPDGEPWRLMFEDRAVGEVSLSGTLHRRDPRVLVILVHGLGGCGDSLYIRRAARAALDLGVSVLRLSQRGAERDGRDFYHGGLTSDLKRALTAPELAEFDDVVVLGFSLGGHQALRWATEAGDPRLRAVAAVCSPLDFETSQRDFDRPVRAIYRRYVLSALRDIYLAVAARRPVPVAPEQVVASRTLREWDRLCVVPRFGFSSVGDYYARASVAPRLHRLRVPALLVAARHDPMITERAVRLGLRSAHPELRVVWSDRGGHVGFPPDVDFGLGGPPGRDPQVLHWLLSHLG
ncbi:MAG: alpha/beta fold hydrolase [Acidobacteriota bacterium]